MARGTGQYSGGASGGNKFRRRGISQRVVPVNKQSITKSISYSATTNDTLLEVTKTASGSEASSGDINRVKVSNVGQTPGMAIFQYQR